MSTEKPNGKTQAPEPVESSGWFGDVFISSRISAQLSADCNREPREIHEKKSAPRRNRSAKFSVPLCLCGENNNHGDTEARRKAYVPDAES